MENGELYKSNQNKAIKAKLIQHWNSLDPKPTLEQLTTKISDNFFDISYSTVRSVLTLSGSELEPCPNLNVILALCDLWKLDYSTVFAPTDGNSFVDSQAFEKSSEATPLNDNGYWGAFHGYMYSRSLDSDGISYFKLSIQQDIAFLDVYESNSDGIINDDPSHYTGVPILLIKSKIVFIIFSQEKSCKNEPINGAYSYIFCFEYLHFNSNCKTGLYFRKGIVITKEPLHDSMIIENFVLFKKSHDDKKKIISGLLAFFESGIFVKQQTINKMCEDPEGKKFIEDHKHCWDRSLLSGYYVKPNRILEEIDIKCIEEIEEIVSQFLTMISYEGTITRFSYADKRQLIDFVNKCL